MPSGVNVASGPAAEFYLRPVYCEIPAYTPPGTGSTTVPAPAVSKSACDSPAVAGLPTTPPSQDSPTATVILPTDPAAFNTGAFRYVLGPADLDGSAISTATAVADPVTGAHSVDVTLTGKGAVEFDQLASARFACYQQDPSVPPFCSFEAFELDGVVESAPAFQAASFNGNISITGDFTASQASTLVDRLKSASRAAPQAPAKSG